MALLDDNGDDNEFSQLDEEVGSEREELSLDEEEEEVVVNRASRLDRNATSAPCSKTEA